MRTDIAQWLNQREEEISKVSRQIDKALDLKEEGQRAALKRIKKASSYCWRYAINRLDCESREHVLALTRKKL